MPGAQPNAAVIAASLAIVNVHPAAPLHAEPIQPTNVLPVAGVAVSVTGVLTGKLALHVVPQVIPGGLDVTVPTPTSVTVTVAMPADPLVSGPASSPPAPCALAHAASAIAIHAWTLIGPTLSPVAWWPINFLSCDP